MASRYNAAAVDQAIKAQRRTAKVSAAEVRLIHAILRGRS
jgi:hypothetical protein